MKIFVYVSKPKTNLVVIIIYFNCNDFDVYLTIKNYNKNIFLVVY